MSTPRPTDYPKTEIARDLLPRYEIFAEALQNNPLLRITYKTIVRSHHRLSAEAALDQAWVFEKIRIALEKNLKIPAADFKISEDILLHKFLEMQNPEDFCNYILAFFNHSAKSIAIDAFRKEFLEQFAKKKRVDTYFKSCYSGNDIQFFTALHETLQSLAHTEVFEDSIKKRNEKQATDIQQVREKIRTAHIEHPIQTLNRLATKYKDNLRDRIPGYEHGQLKSVTIKALITDLESKANARIAQLDAEVKALTERAENWPENDKGSLELIKQRLKAAPNKKEKEKEIARELHGRRKQLLADIEICKTQLQHESKHSNASKIQALKIVATEQKIEIETNQLPEIQPCIAAITQATSKAIGVGIDKSVSLAIKTLTDEIQRLTENSYDRDMKQMYEQTFGTLLLPLQFRQFDQLVNTAANVHEFKAKKPSDQKLAALPALLQPKSIHESLAEKLALVKALHRNIAQSVEQKKPIHEYEIKQLSADLHIKAKPATQFVTTDLKQQLHDLNDEEKTLCTNLGQFYDREIASLKQRAKEYFDAEWLKKLDDYNNQLATIKNRFDTSEQALRRSINAIDIDATLKKMRREAETNAQREEKERVENSLRHAREHAEKAAATVVSISASPKQNLDALLLARNEAVNAEQHLKGLSRTYLRQTTEPGKQLGYAILAGVVAPIAWLYGGYLLATYATGSKIAGVCLAFLAAIFTTPYAWWVGVKTIYHNNASEYTRGRNAPLLSDHDMSEPLLGARTQRSSSSDNASPIAHIKLPTAAPLQPPKDHARIEEKDIPLLIPKINSGILILRDEPAKRTYIQSKPCALYQADGKRNLHLQIDEKTSKELGNVTSKLLADITRLIKHPDDIKIHGIVGGGWLKITVNNVDFHLLPNTPRYHAVLQKFSGTTPIQINYALFDSDDKLLQLLYPTTPKTRPAAAPTTAEPNGALVALRL